MARRVLSRCLAAGTAVLLTAGLPAATASAEAPTRIVGLITKSTGQPVGNASVTVYNPANRNFVAFARTDGAGNYAIELPASGLVDFKIEIRDEQFNTEFMHGKRTFEDADLIHVTSGQDNIVNETIPVGSLSFTASDKVTGTPINNLCADLSGQGVTRGGCTETGTVTITDLAPGDYQVGTAGDDHYFGEFGRHTTVVSNQTTDVHFSLAPAGLITTTIRDASTGNPVANACVLPLKSPNLGGFSNFGLYCSATDGSITIGRMETGTHRLFVFPGDSAHGSQWVGPQGGTGSYYSAKPVDVTAGQTVAGPAILLDGAGSISGTVTDRATGAPVAGICAFTHTGGTTGGPDPASYCTKEDGKYTISGVGPYDWPVQFIDTIGSHAWQWSGDRSYQLNAKPVTVRAGLTTPLDAHLGPGSTVSGRVTLPNGQPVENAVVVVYNAFTGDSAGNYTFTDAQGRYTVDGIAGPQSIRLSVDNSPGLDHTVWFAGASSFERATQFYVGSGANVTGINVVIR